MLLRRASKARLFSKIDFKWGYFQRKVDDESMGFANSGTDFQAEMEDIFMDFADFVAIFQDDLLIFSENEEQHIRIKKSVCGSKAR
uniref:Reverse transcriptase domain-containing protein n=1 Tax=Arcella intermedia TaxID=1963864 RepID=A0A6B2LPW8_9EUKA